ncbi:Uncharacterised protein [Bordetella pertussis]|nr:Uncharacterised protein [Bordetella pertussis]
MAQARRAYAQRRAWLADALRAEGIAAHHLRLCLDARDGLKKYPMLL